MADNGYEFDGEAIKKAGEERKEQAALASYWSGNKHGGDTPTVHDNGLNGQHVKGSELVLPHGTHGL